MDCIHWEKVETIVWNVLTQRASVDATVKAIFCMCEAAFAEGYEKGKE